MAALNLEFRSTYKGYLTALGQAVRQQLILACYHLCTQAAPESFLKLSFDGRQKMQQSVRCLAIASQEKLRSLVTPESESEIESESESEIESESDFFAINFQFPARNNQLSIANSPESWARWQESIEKSIANIIKLLSRDTNRLLKQVGILPHQLPEPVLLAASQADSSGDSVAGPPNLLNLIIETNDSSESESLGETRGTTAIQITAIKLRLSEIEFADAETSAWRQQIRNLSVRLNAIGRDYQKKQRELAVVEAESAWRASWYED
ncbi:MAG TPA: hypothetical protein DCS91_04470 [Microcoleaceae bacterium UBA11344]|nr:hypothetical protein [Microcoleaceae cyanobacterium UBA11344]